MQDSHQPVKAFPPICFLVVLVISLALNGCKGNDSSASGGDSWDYTTRLDYGRAPVWSPDGDMIAFGDDRPGNAGIFLYNLEDEPVQIATDVPAHNWDYSFSPEGSQVLFSCPGGVNDSSAGIWVYTLDTDSSVKVYSQGKDVCWFKDNAHIIFRQDNPVGSAPGLYLLQIADDSSGIGLPELIMENGHKPAIAQRTGYIAYIENERSGFLHVLDDQLTPLFTSDRGVVDFKWSANGKVLAYIINDYVTGELSGELWSISDNDWTTPNDQALFAAYCSPDSAGAQIAYSRWAASRWVGLWLVREPNYNEQIAPYGLFPVFNPRADKIASNAPNGGIRILTRAG